MLRAVFRVSNDEIDEVLDRLLPALPMGVTVGPVSAGHVDIAVVGTVAALGSGERLEELAGRAAHRVEEVPADWRRRRARLGESHHAAGGIVVRSPWDPPAADGMEEVVIERGAGSFGTGAHPTTQMSLALLAELAPAGSAVDLGCGTGILAIAAARLGWVPVVAVDRDPEAVEQARANALRNDVEITFEVVDVEAEDVPLATLVLANAPPPVHRRIADALHGGARWIVASGIAEAEVAPILERYAVEGYRAVSERAERGWAALTLARADG